MLRLVRVRLERESVRMRQSTTPWIERDLARVATEAARLEVMRSVERVFAPGDRLFWG